jgi:tRNA-2-methylthio-N6-dimethylallyladenosine synthase
VDVLLERPGRHPGQLAGKTPYLQAVQIDGGPAVGGLAAGGPRVGDVVPVRITGQATNSLFGAFGGTREATAA